MKRYPKKQVVRRIEFTVKSVPNTQTFGKVWHVGGAVYRKVRGIGHAWELEDSGWTALPDSKAWSIAELAFWQPPLAGPMYDAAVSRMIRKMKRALVKHFKTNRSQEGAGI